MMAIDIALRHDLADEIASVLPADYATAMEVMTDGLVRYGQKKEGSKSPPSPQPSTMKADNVIPFRKRSSRVPGL